MNFIKYILTFILLIMAFIISLYLVASIPSNDGLYNNCLLSAQELVHEGGFYSLFLSETLDNNSDAIIVNESYCLSNGNPFESAMLMRRSYDPSITKYIVKEQVGNLETHYLNQFDQSGKPIADYKLFDSNSDVDDFFSNCKETLNFLLGKVSIASEYPRYWHGFIIFFRPLLFIFNINQIRLILLRNNRFSTY